jgi:hypothetical protein
LGVYVPEKYILICHFGFVWSDFPTTILYIQYYDGIYGKSKKIMNPFVISVTIIRNGIFSLFFIGGFPSFVWGITTVNE